MLAAKFDDSLKVELIEIRKNEVYFKLEKCEVFVDGYVEAEPCTAFVFKNNSPIGDPQCDYEVEVDSLKLHHDSVCFLDDSNGVFALQNMPFQLTASQLYSLNEQIEWHFTGQ